MFNKNMYYVNLKFCIGETYFYSEQKCKKKKLFISFLEVQLN